MFSYPSEAIGASASDLPVTSGEAIGALASDLPGFYACSPSVGLGPPPRVDHLHPLWVCDCGRPYPSSDHVCTYCGKRHDAGDVVTPPASVQMSLQPPFSNAMEDDGPLSVAYRMQPQVIGIRPQIPAPNTGQYPYRYDARKMETWGQIKSYELITGYAQASIDPDADSGISEEDLQKLNLGHREDRLVYMVLSGWALMMWRSEEEYNRGKSGARNAPRALGWWDMRMAHDVAVTQGERDSDEKCPHRIAVLTNGGVVYFRVPDSMQEVGQLMALEEQRYNAELDNDTWQEQTIGNHISALKMRDVLIWYNAIRGLIREYNYQFIKSRDTKHHQEKRWPCAKGMAGCLMSGRPMGERAMAIAFHCYDIDFNCIMGVGEIMVMIEEVEAGIRNVQGFKEAEDRASAMESSLSKFSGGLNEIFEKAMTFRNSCDKDGNGQVRKDEFICNGQFLLAQALGFSFSGGGQLGQPEDAGCSVM